MKEIIVALVFSCAFAACGGYSTGTIQKSEKGFLKFTGNTQAVMVSIDAGARFPCDEKIDLYEVKPGQHTIKVYRNNEMIVNRTVVVDNQTTFEIEVP